MDDPVVRITAQPEQISHPETERRLGIPRMRADGVQAEKKRDQQIGRIRERKPPVGSGQMMTGKWKRSCSSGDSQETARKHMPPSVSRFPEAESVRWDTVEAGGPADELAEINPGEQEGNTQ